MTLKEYLNNRTVKLENLITEKIKQISSYPKGILRISKHGNGYQYFFRENKSDKNGKYIKKSQQKLAVQLAQKKYDEALIKAAKNELSKIEPLLAIINEGTIEDVYSTFSEPYRKLVTPIELPIEEFVQNWQNQPYERLGFEPNSPEHYTDKGIRVRSKSEVLIANLLDAYKIPYKIEVPIKLKNGEIKSPDFTILDVRTRKEIIWEHFGKMDDPSYAIKNVRKIWEYNNSGIFLGDNFIATFETTDFPLNTKQIKQQIRKYLL